MTAQHTPTPWKVGPFDEAQQPYGAAIYYELADDDGAAVDIAHMIRDGRAPEAMKADAAFIVRAVNSHALLVAALEAIHDGIEPDECGNREVPSAVMDQVRAALHAAQGVTP